MIRTRRIRTLLLAAALSCTSLPAFAALVDLSVVDRDSGQVLPSWPADGRRFIAGTEGHRYALRVSNRSAGRVLVVLSVDGVNVVTGEDASPDQRGYVLDAGMSTEITGWRKSLGEVAQFRFSLPADSYAARTGRAANLGVIGAAVFTERVVPPPPPAPMLDSARPSAAESAAGRRAAAPSVAQALGTAHGERERSVVRETAFERATRTPAERIALWYDSYANLLARGVIPAPRRHDVPDPFPGGFVPDPSS